jgi:hypothetical protein
MQLEQINRDLVRANQDLAESAKRSAKENESITRIKKSITKNTSLFSLQSKNRQIDTHYREIEKQEKKKVELQKKITTLTLKKVETEKKLRNEEFKINQELNNEVNVVKRLNQELIEQVERERREKLEAIQKKAEILTSLDNEFDVFISHASEDKSDFVEPLSKILTEHNISVFYDKASIDWGDSIPTKIDKGILQSKICLLVISPNFIRKKWTQREKDAFMMLDDKKILPVWHKVSKDEVQNFSPTIASIKALNTADNTLEEIAEKLQQVLSKNTTQMGLSQS